MSATNCTAFPIKGQALRVRLSVYSSLTGLLITSGLTGLSAKIAKDDAAAVATTNNPVESGMPGVVYLDLTATEMNANGVCVYLTATNTNAFSPVVEIAPLNLTESTGAALDQSQVLFEQVVLDIMAAAINLNSLNSSVYTIYKRDSSTPKISGTYTQGSESATRSKLS